MTKNHITTLRVVGIVAERITDLNQTSDSLTLARSNFSEFLRAAVDAFIAGEGEIVSTQVLGNSLNTKVASGGVGGSANITNRPQTVSMPPHIHAHYARVAKAQGQTLSALYNSALVAALT